MLPLVLLVTCSGELHQRTTHEARSSVLGEEVEPGLVEVPEPVCQLLDIAS